MKNKAIAVAGAFGMFLAFTVAKNLLVRPAAAKVAVAANLPQLPALLA